MTEDIIKAAKKAVAVDCEFGHSDVGDVLVSFLKEEIDEDEALMDLEFLRQGYEDG